MTHDSGNWCAARWQQNINRPDPLNYIDTLNLKNLLVSDAASYCYSALVCIADACSAVQGGFYSWATTKLYYAAFYGARGLLAVRDVCVFYVGRKPYIVDVMPGGLPNKPSRSEAVGGTHGLVLGLFSKRSAGHILVSQPIGRVDPFEWMRSRREDANYNSARYFEPQVPPWFAAVARTGIRKAVNAYLNDSQYAYSFDQDHAIIAFPLLVIRFLLKEVRTKAGSCLVEEDVQYLMKQLADSRGPIAEWGKLLRDP